MSCASFLITSIIFLILFADGVRGSEVRYLPGFQAPLPFHLQTGYVGVDQGENVQLFYYFVESSSDPGNDPLLLWLTGGPGCSVFSGLIYEIGPISFAEEYDGGLPALTLNPNSWTQEASILFVDLPVGTGFSYARRPEAAATTGVQSCHQAYEFLNKWLLDHPRFLSNPFYVGGDSYVGITVPTIVQIISDANEMGHTPQINIKGYILGNPKTFPNESNYMVPYAHGMGLISNELYQSLDQNCGGNYFGVNSKNVRCLKDVQTFHQLIDDVNSAQILEPLCPFYTPRPPNFSGERRILVEEKIVHYNDMQLATTKCHTDRYKLAPLWTNDPSVREALHIRKGTVESWVRCNSSLPYTNQDWDSIPYHANLSAKGFRSLIYSGDHDMLVPFLSTEAWIKSLNYPITDEWRPWRVENQVAGYTRTYANNMTFATVKGAGHTAPEYRPLECAAMFKRWISSQPL